MGSDPIALARGWPGDWQGVVQVVESTEPLRTRTLATCPHRHRSGRTARVCAQRLRRALLAVASDASRRDADA